MLNLAVVGGIGGTEIIIVLVIVLLLFGARRLPEVGRSLGQGMREFKDSVTGKDRDEEPERLEPGTKADASAEEAHRDRAPAGQAGTSDKSS
jgi:sec-independent protein translocase protein TatA